MLDPRFIDEAASEHTLETLWGMLIYADLSADDRECIMEAIRQLESVED